MTIKISEKKLLENFGENLKKKGIDSIEIADGNKSSIMDFNFVNPITNTYISLEAKTFNDTRSNSNFFLSLFGKIMKGRHLNKNNQNCKDKKVEYGFLFAESNLKVIKKYFDMIENEDWNNFCNSYDCNYIFINKSGGYDVYDSQNFKKNAFTNVNDINVEIVDTEETDEIEEACKTNNNNLI